MSSATADIQDRLDFMHLDDESRMLLPKAWEIIEPDLPRILAAFYDHMRSRENLAELLGDAKRIETLKSAQQTHWATLFEGRFDQDYMDRAYRIGHAHARIGLEPRWYVAAYAFFMTHLTQVVSNHFGRNHRKASAVLTAVQKAVFLDMEIAISVYNDVERSAREARTRRIEELVAQFDSTSREVIGLVTESTNGIRAAVERMNKSAGKDSTRTLEVSNAAERARTNIASVASATEELAATSREVGQQMSQSTMLVGNAVDQARQSNDQVKGLAQAVENIGSVVSLINDIASQTNLLALNATIEAARAGEAGKGFAIVASEVKELAKQTTHATEEIESQIQSIQSATDQAVSMIEAVTETVNQLNEIATTISAAAEEQSAATDEIARNAVSVSEDAVTVSGSVSNLSQASAYSYAAAIKILWAAKQMQKPVDDLDNEVSVFLSGVKSA